MSDAMRWAGVEVEGEPLILKIHEPYTPTRRDYFAAAALTGMLGSHYASTAPGAAEEYAKAAVRLADATIAELGK